MNSVTAERGVSMFDVMLEIERGTPGTIYERVEDVRVRDNMLFMRGKDMDGEFWNHATTLPVNSKVIIKMVSDYDKKTV